MRLGAIGTLVLVLGGGIVGAAATVAFLDNGGHLDGSTTTMVEDIGDGSSVGQSELAAALPAGPAPTMDVRGLYRDRAPGVVTITAVVDGEPVSGSGFVVSPDGHVMTNAHVITTSPVAETAEEVRTAERVFVRFADGNSVPAEVVGYDLFDDIGVLQVDPEGLDLTVLRFGDAEELQVGDPLAVIGSPFGAEQAESLSLGVVSALGRSILPPAVSFETPGAIQTDAAINHGNSGGPVFDANGRVVGVAAQIESTGGGGEGVGFAVPASLAKRSLEQLVADGKVRYAWLGAATTPVTADLAHEFKLPVNHGLLVEGVTAGGPAGKAGLRAGERTESYQAELFPVHPDGDVILSLDGEEVHRQEDLTRILSTRTPGQKVKLAVMRGKEQVDLEVTLGERPHNVAR